MKNKTRLFFIFLFIVLAGCGRTIPETYNYRYDQDSYDHQVKAGEVLGSLSLDRETEDRILALDPENITEKDVRDILSHAPAPRIINIHGGMSSVYIVMVSLSKFLMSMGYPENSLRNPADGTYSYSCLKNVKEFTGIIGWYYEREGMMPIIIGHSQGGMMVIRILHYLAGSEDSDLMVWNPVTETQEDRHTIIDPLEHKERPVAGLKLGYASSIAAGGTARLLLNQWDVVFRLRKIPDTVEEFSGFYLSWDSAGTDYLGLIDAPNRYRPVGSAGVRTIKLSGGSHFSLPDVQHLAEQPETREWVDEYRPDNEQIMNDEIIDKEYNIPLAGELWYHIKKYLAIEAQRMIRARRDMEKWQAVN
ncbi:MAG TPA: hypothetical protein ENH31_07360 [Nitrospirae bacterium]|nr:hypothetical protein [Nitrospirota bacterium]HDK17049.1 hypothetical protein [Nitrospirota bacterium]HDK82375.1 hypothetical protein [Nitrospirota bacterium]